MLRKIDDERPSVGTEESVDDVRIGGKRRSSKRGDLIKIHHVAEYVGDNIFAILKRENFLRRFQSDITGSQPRCEAIADGRQGDAFALPGPNQVLDSDDPVKISQPIGCHAAQ